MCYLTGPTALEGRQNWITRNSRLLVVLLQLKFTFLFIFQTVVRVTILSFTINTMKFTVSSNGTQWVLDFGPDSVVLSVRDLDENLTIRSLEILLAAWSLLLSQRQEFLNNHLPRVPIAPNQHGTFEKRKEVLSSVGAQGTDTRGYELSDLEDTEIISEGPAVDMDSVYRLGIDTPFSRSTFDDFQMQGSTAANPKKVDDEAEKENSAPTTSIPESERPTEPLRLLRTRPFGTRLENVPESVYRTLFRQILYLIHCMCFVYTSN